MALDKNTTVLIEDARIMFRNFRGEERPMNREGDRNFAVLLDPVIAEQMAADGWLIKPAKEMPSGDIRDPYISVKVSFDGRPPKVVMITSRGRTDITEETVNLLDYCIFKHVDLIFRPYQWTVGDKSGVKAYLKSMYVTIEEDQLDLKYSDVPDAVAPQREDEYDYQEI